MESKIRYLRGLWEEWRDCSRCTLCKKRTQIVMGSGNPDARIMIISDKPGVVEDRYGYPMMGPAGEYYDNTLFACGLTREDVWTTNCVMCAPPDNRDPFTPELAACKERLRQEILTIDPWVIVLMGRVATNFVLGVNRPIKKMQLRTHVIELTTPTVAVQYLTICTYNPAWIRKHPPNAPGQPHDFMIKAVGTAVEIVKTMERKYYGPLAR